MHDTPQDILNAEPSVREVYYPTRHVYQVYYPSIEALMADSNLPGLMFGRENSDGTIEGVHKFMPQQMFGHPRFHEMLRLIGEMHEKKAHDYSGKVDPFANFRTSEALGIKPVMGVMVRMSDKWERIKVLLTAAEGPHVKEETITDTLMDLASYALIAIILLEEERAGDNAV